MSSQIIYCVTSAALLYMMDQQTFLSNNSYFKRCTDIYIITAYRERNIKICLTRSRMSHSYLWYTNIPYRDQNYRYRPLRYYDGQCNLTNFFNDFKYNKWPCCGRKISLERFLSKFTKCSAYKNYTRTEFPSQTFPLGKVGDRFLRLILLSHVRNDMITVHKSKKILIIIAYNNV